MAIGLVTGCGGAPTLPPPPATGGPLFTLLPAAYTGVRFVNRLTSTRDLNVFTYRNFYNGGGVALGDLTGDGLPEIVLTSNQGGPHLYLNEGRFRFRDVTAEAGLRNDRPWTTGVTLADVNGDGRLDIYLCHAGNVDPARRANELYIQQAPRGEGGGVPRFVEQAAAWGLADQGYATHAAFVDYDRDGRLDLFLVNNAPRSVVSLGRQNTRNVRDPFGGDKLYHNVGDRFVDVSAQAGIFESEIAFGLGVAVSDFNRDGWPDIYVSNDFFERDYLYLNNRDGTFTEALERAMPIISYASMGLDAADVDDDGQPDLYVVDMLPEDDYRLKTTTSFEDWGTYEANVANGYHHQVTRNMLQLNNGNGSFSEIGQMAGVARTDWSWSALIADYDLDGRKDIYVTNGIARDVTSQDYVTFLAKDETMRAAMRGDRVDFLKLVAAMDSTPLPNYAFRNRGDLTFSNESVAWGLATPGFSSGAAYGDLDGDGALDLVVNNVDAEAFVYRNNVRTVSPANHYLQVQLTGQGVGAEVTVWHGAALSFQELQPSRGFQSSVDNVLTFGVGAADSVDSVRVDWPGGRSTTVRHVATNQRLTLRESDAHTGGDHAPRPTPHAPLFTDITAQAALPFAHHEDAFVDFDREPLIPKLLSTEGPYLAVADVNGDGLDDMFVGGARDQPGALLLQTQRGRFVTSNEGLLDQDRVSEDLGAVFFDADGDGDPDLYVVSGGSEFSTMAPALQDRLYLNDGHGRFGKATANLPVEYNSGSRVAAADFDGDGDVDLFVGGRVVPWRYGADPRSTLLQNDGHGHFTDVTARLAPDLEHIGMVTDALWIDVDGDRRLDLVVVGEWMPVTIFRNAGASGGRRLVRQDTPGLARSNGWWNRIVAGDFTGDGRVDFVVGNLGLNTRLHATDREPVTMYVKDFDRNGSVEQIVATYQGGVSRPLAMRDELTDALPYLKARYPTYKAYAGQAVTDVFSSGDLAGAIEKHAYTFATALARNNGDGSFTLAPLPRAAQLAPVYGMLAGDFDGNGTLDLVLAGNFDGVKPEIGRMSASYGLFLRGDGKGSFTPVRTVESGFFVPGQARDIARIRTRAGVRYVVTRNNDGPLVFRARP